LGQKAELGPLSSWAGIGVKRMKWPATDQAARKIGTESRENEYGLEKCFSNLVQGFQFKIQGFSYL
jgi:hypothetical protein